MNPQDPPPRTGALWVFTLCAAALTLAIWMEWMSTQDRGLFMPASAAPADASTDVAPRSPPGR